MLNIKKVDAYFIDKSFNEQNINELSALLNTHNRQLIDHLLWSKNGYCPQVQFVIAYNHESILLKYYVQEQHVRTFYQDTNDPVYKDSCVEFFIAFANDSKYYNLEFNSAGVALAGYGPDQQNRSVLPKQVVSKILTYSSIIPPAQNNELTSWALTLQIPFSFFAFHHLTSLKGEACRGNFYKCGDELPQPHFLSWNEISYPYPCFHLPEFFGQINFK